VGEDSTATAREVEETRKLAKRVVFAVLTAVVVLMARKLVDKLWERATGELPPTKVERDDD
jgi:hypothetical protein